MHLLVLGGAGVRLSCV